MIGLTHGNDISCTHCKQGLDVKWINNLGTVELGNHRVKCPDCDGVILVIVEVCITTANSCGVL